MEQYQPLRAEVVIPRTLVGERHTTPGAAIDQGISYLATLIGVPQARILMAERAPMTGDECMSVYLEILSPGCFDPAAGMQQRQMVDLTLSVEPGPVWSEDDPAALYRAFSLTPE